MNKIKYKLMIEKIFGTSLYIDKILIQTEYGEFMAYTYQDLIHKGYIIALTYGDIHSDTLYTRIHSSCVTSETLRSQDCDCVQQLYGAFKKIHDKGNGILFYLIQEGRGCGFVGKSRDRMYVQHSNDEMTTFEAYKMLGLKKDYRNYSNIKDICTMLEINPNFILLTNNPDKINGLKKLGLNVTKTETIEYIPNPFNRNYLLSKHETGHVLSKVHEVIPKYEIPFQPCEPFIPYHLKNCTRFIHVSSYYLPIKPIGNRIILSQAEFDNYVLKNGTNIAHSKIPNDKILIEVDDELLKKFPELSHKPYWFKISCFYDIATNNDVLVLEYGNTKNNPVIRIHSESLLNRFPLNIKDNKFKYNQSISLIVGHGSGIIILFYEDGRGSVFGGLVLEKKSQNTGIKKDNRDYRGIAHLLKEYINPNKIILLYTCLQSHELSTKELEKVGIKIDKHIFISKGKKGKGNFIIKERIAKAIDYLKDLTNGVQLIQTNKRKEQLIQLLTADNIIFTGIGTSEAHAKYIMYLLKKYAPVAYKNLEYVPLIEFYDKDKTFKGTVVIFSQGLSPNAQVVFEKMNYKSIVLFTATTGNNKNTNKVNILKKLNNEPSNFVINFPIEDEYTTLIRIIGPICGYIYSFKLISQLFDVKLTPNTIQKIYDLYLNFEILTPTENFVNSLVRNKRICILCDSESIKYIGNIKCKFIEGVFFESIVIADYFEFAHGVFQNLEFNMSRGIITDIIILNRNNDPIVKQLHLMLKNYNIWNLENNLQDEMKIIHYEISLNYLISQLISRLDIDQINWVGKDKGKLIYGIKN